MTQATATPCTPTAPDHRPALLGSRRHADLLIGTTLIEVKTGQLDKPEHLNNLINQLLTYALLATHDGHPVTHIAVYAARYQQLLRYPLQQILNDLANTPADLSAAATRLATLIQANEPAPADP